MDVLDNSFLESNDNNNYNAQKEYYEKQVRELKERQNIINALKENLQTFGDDIKRLENKLFQGYITAFFQKSNKAIKKTFSNQNYRDDLKKVAQELNDALRIIKIGDDLKNNLDKVIQRISKQDLEKNTRMILTKVIYLLYILLLKINLQQKF